MAHYVSVQTNITVDDGNSTMITYNPPECNGSGWTVEKTGGVGGSFRHCTTAGGPSATITFHGVAVYYRSPILKSGTMRFRLDGVLSDDVSLVSHSAAANLTGSQIIWKQTQLDNKLHTLGLFPPSGGETLNVDAFIITQVTSLSSTNVSTTRTTSTTTTVSQPSGSQTSLSQPTIHRVALGVGITAGCIGLIGFLLVARFLRRRQRAMRKQLEKRYEPSFPIEPSVFSRGFTYDSSTHSLRKGGVIVPREPLPNLPPGAYPADVDPARYWSSPVPSHSILMQGGGSESLDHGDYRPNHVGYWSPAAPSHSTLMQCGDSESLDQGDSPPNRAQYWPSPSPSHSTFMQGGGTESLGHGDYPRDPASRGPTPNSRLEPVRRPSEHY